MNAREGPPGPGHLPLVAGALGLVRFMHDPLALYSGLAQRHGDAVFLKVGGVPVYLMLHPDQVQDVLVTHARSFVRDPWATRLKSVLGNCMLLTDGAIHMRQRRMIQPAFRRQLVAGYAAAMVAHAAEASRRWRDGARVDMASEMSSVTLDIICTTVLDSAVAADKAFIADALDVFAHWFAALGLPFGRRLLKLPLPFVHRFEQSRAGLRQLISRMLDEHRREAEGHDLLAMLLAARDVEGDGDGMTDDEIVDEVASFFLAGHESTALVLTWAWALLAQHPQAEQTLVAELEAVLGEREPTIDDLPALRFARGVVSEAMRLYPPLWAMSRLAVEDVDLAGYRIPRGAVVTLCPYVTHRDARWWPDADRFHPERWATDGDRPRYAYFPFGAGNRFCIGEHFAWMEAVLILAVLARRWSARIAPGHVVGTRPIVTLRPRGGMPMLLHQRQRAVG